MDKPGCKLSMVMNMEISRRGGDEKINDNTSHFLMCARKKRRNKYRTGFIDSK